MAAVGYAFLREHLGLGTLPIARPAMVRPVTRVQDHNGELQVPAHVAPAATSTPLEHILFALKHEGTDLQTLAAALPLVEPKDLVSTLQRTPTGGYIRKACYLWEVFTGRKLELGVSPGGPYVPVFDPDLYVTATERTDARWRVKFNGIGSIGPNGYCPTVRRTRDLTASLKLTILDRMREFVDKTDWQMLDRALTWAYLHETESSFELEREAPAPDRAQAFVDVLKHAHDRRPPSEDYLVELQNSVIANPLLREVQYRTEQNWLRGALRGAAGITYVPPPPGLAAQLMNQLLALAARQGDGLDPLVRASLVSFGFVFIHPFMDGNGRLSRFLFHHTLCMEGVLDRGLLLPVSVAIKRNEQAYLRALQSFSKPARELWQVRMIDADHYEFNFTGSEVCYRYWDATACVEFGLRMAQQALQIDLQQETEFLARFDEAAMSVSARFDLRNNDLVTLVLCAHDQRGRISERRRKQFALTVQPEAFDFIEEVVTDVFGFDGGRPVDAPGRGGR